MTQAPDKETKIKKISAIIVDDEVLARINIRKAIEAYPKWQVLTELSEGSQLYTALEYYEPDVIFLDIQMPGENGIEVAKKLLKLKTKALIIFITAFDGFAVQAFEFYAIDYLLKPFNNKRFSQALLKAEQYLINNLSSHSIKAWQAKHFGSQSHIDKIMIKSSGSIRIVLTEDIYFFAASGNYVEIHHKDGTDLQRIQLKFIETQLNPEEFFRVHRSAIIKLSEVKEFKSLDENQYAVVLSNKKQVRVSSGFKGALMSKLGMDQ